MFHSSRVGRLLHAVYLLLAAAVGAGACYVWALRCENFGCMGLGVAWAAWAALLFLPALALGGYLAARRGPRDGFARLTRWMLMVQLVVGAALAAFWIASRLR